MEPFPRVTDQVESWIREAITYANGRSHRTLHPRHFLGTAMGQPLNVDVVRLLGLSPEALDRDIEAEVEVAIPLDDYGPCTDLQGTELHSFLDMASNVSTFLDSRAIGTQHMLVALVSLGEFSHFWETHGVTRAGVLNVLPSALKQVPPATRATPVPGSTNGPSGINGEGVSAFGSSGDTRATPNLDRLGLDLTREAREGHLDPVVGRDGEIREVVQMLSRRSKNNPVVVGEPGVGKTALVEGLALRMASGDVPGSLRNHRLVSLSLTSLLAGAKMRGEFEQRLNDVLNEAASAEDVVLFMDEIHLLNSGQTQAAADAIKPMLARGTLRLVGATTVDEYRQHIESDPALERRFQKVVLEEPSVEDTVAILRGVAPRFEAFHGVAIRDSALEAAARLSHRFVADRCLPDKAIDLIDVAATRLRMALDSSPDEIDSLQRQVDRLRMEESALERQVETSGVAEDDNASTLAQRRAELEERLIELRARWEHEQGLRNELGTLRTEMADLRSQSAHAVARNDFEHASRAEYDDLPRVQGAIDRVEAEIASSPRPLVADAVGSDEVAAVVESWTGIPVGRLLEGEAQKLLRMEEELGRRVIGQAEAITAISDAVRRSRAGVNDPKRPTGSFLFLGPSGTGKTELAKALASFLFDDENAMVRVDMSEFSEKHSVARLVGAPPGYVGYESGGQLTEAVRQRPYSVVLLDEAEKAHPEVFDILLQVFDDGRLTDGQGHTVDFKNTIIVLTSNLGSSALVDPDMTTEEKHAEVMEAVRASFRPEFLNRLDESVIFHALSKGELGSIVDIQVGEFARRLADRALDFQVTDGARAWLAEEGYEPAYGARPLRRLIQREIGDRVARLLLAGDVAQGSTIVVDVAPTGEHLQVTRGRVNLAKAQKPAPERPRATRSPRPRKSGNSGRSVEVPRAAVAG